MPFCRLRHRRQGGTICGYAWGGEQCAVRLVADTESQKSIPRARERRERTPAKPRLLSVSNAKSGRERGTSIYIIQYILFLLFCYIDYKYNGRFVLVFLYGLFWDLERRP
jgi:hypothetical protein